MHCAPVVSFGVLRNMLHAFVSCCMDCMNTLIARFPLCDIRRLVTVQNASGHLFGDVSK